MPPSASRSHPTNESLAVGSSSQNVYLMPFAQEGSTRILRGHISSVDSVSFFPDGTPVSHSMDDAVRVWDGKPGRSDLEFQGPANACRRVRGNAGRSAFRHQRGPGCPHAPLVADGRRSNPPGKAQALRIPDRLEPGLQTPGVRAPLSAGSGSRSGMLPPGARQRPCRTKAPASAACCSPVTEASCWRQVPAAPRKVD